MAVQQYEAYVCLFFSVSQRSLHTDSCLALCVLSYTLMVYTFYCSVADCYKSFGDMSAWKHCMEKLVNYPKQVIFHSSS